MEEIIRCLNPAQKEAVTWPGGPLLVVAGPGSGKTRVITHRIAWLVSRGIPPFRILGITFTNKAADEMKERARKLIGAGSGIWIGTFHSVCTRILRREIEALGYKSNFTIYDTEDRDRLIKGILREKGIDKSIASPGMVGKAISRLKTFRDHSPSYHDYRYQLDIAEEILPIYEKRMKLANALDFDDLLLKVVLIFEEFPSVRERWSGRFLHVLVDEFQDTNYIQYRLSGHLSSVHGNLTVVGDPDQSIYTFRGATIRNILEFEKDYPGAKVINLEENYRSSKVILKAAHSVIANNVERKEKGLWTRNDLGPPLEVHEAENAEEEAEEVVNAVLRWHSSGIPYREMAVFYRTNSRSRTLEKAFSSYGIPYKVIGALSFFQRKEIKDILAWLKLLENPFDEVSFYRAALNPPRGIGEKTVSKVAEESKARGISFVDVAGRPEGIPRVPARARDGLKALAGIIACLEEARPGPMRELVEKAVELTGYRDWLHEVKDPSEAGYREENLDELINAAAEYDRKYPGAGLTGFLETVSLVSDQDAMDKESDHVSLMTLHTAKGLEFDAVAIVGMEQGTLPHELSLDSVRGIEEERRLFYVGITRARKHIRLSYSKELLVAGKWKAKEPSRFLDEVPEECFFLEPRDQEDAEPEYIPGARVRHQAFGLGTIVSVSGRNRNLKVVVIFDKEGERTIIPEYSNLEIL